MLAPISWLKDFVDINVTPEVLAKKLVAIGFEVENIIYQNRQATKVVVGKIIKVEKHPNADRLRVTQIDIGKNTIQVVTNVPVEGGETVAVALDGATLFGGKQINKGELRGVMSEGMLCGLEEVGLTVDDAPEQKQSDILRFEDGTPLGINALDALHFNDVVLDVAVTANRPDCNSIYKLAKEVAVALGVDCKEPHINYKAASGGEKDIYDFKGEYTRDILRGVEVKNSELCPRYMACGVKNVRVSPSNQLIKSRLRAVGLRPINNIVDITNYVLTEIGQPMHAFDRRDILGEKIVVRNAQEGEKIVTLDGKTNVLKKEMLVICDEERPLAVAGIMGGLESGVKEDTHEIIFEAAKFARDNIRRTSRALNLRSDSSSRFEKGIDFASQKLGMERALTLVYESGAGDILQGMFDEKVDYNTEKEISFTVKQVKDILGCAVPKATLISILARLGVRVTESGNTLVAHVGEDREDIVGVNDIAEEFIRVYGYRHIKPTLFKYSSLTEGSVPNKINIVDKIKDTLSACGLYECVTYSFTSPNFATKLGITDERKDAIRIVNPIGEALSVMRTNLTHSMLETLAYNATHFNREARLFEVARAYIPHELPLKELPDEDERLSIGAYGEGVDFFFIKGALEEVFASLNAKVKYTRSTETFLHPGRSADVYVNGKKAGYFGEVHPDTQKAYGIDNFRAYVAEISIAAICDEHSLDKAKFKQFSRFPLVERDLALVVDEDVPAGDMLDAVNESKIQNLTSSKVFDSYRGEQIGKGKKSVALNFSFSSTERTLTDEEVATAMDKIRRILKKKFGAEIRA